MDIAADVVRWDSVADFLQFRGALRLLSPFSNAVVIAQPSFWNKIILSPKAPLEFLRTCIARSSALPLLVVFHASGLGVTHPLTFGDAPCSIVQYVVDAASVLFLDMDRCSSLSVYAENYHLLQLVLDGIWLAEPDRLHALDASFRVDDYSNFRPPFVQGFHFASRPPLGVAFPPFTSLAWISRPVPKRRVSFATTEKGATCSIVHPAEQPITWSDVEVVFESSAYVHTVILDGLDFRLGDARTILGFTAPLHNLRVLDLTLHGCYALASLVSRLNLPCIRTLRLTVTDPRDFDCLAGCGAVLSAIQELVLIGSCKPLLAMSRIYAAFHRLERLDLRMGTEHFFRELMHASHRTSAFSSVNWYACPVLSILLVQGVHVEELQRLVVCRESQGYSKLVHISVGGATAVADHSKVEWFRARGIAYTVVNDLS